jgi:hypothetical protein
MKIKSFLLTTIALTGILSAANAQLYNNGGTITIQNNASVIVTGEVINTAGTITNDGKLEVKGNFTNAGTYTSTAAEDSLLLTGTGTSLLTTGGAILNYLTINKTTAADIVKLGGNILVNKKLDYLSGLFTTDPLLNPTFAVVSPITAVYNFAPGAEIIGSVKRTGWANGATNVFNQTNMLVTTNAGTAPTDVTVTMLPQTGGGDPTQNEREVTRSFKFAQTGGAAFTADIRYPYLTTELNTNTEANLVPWKLIATEWNGLTTGATRDVVNHFVNYTAIPAADLALEWKLADPKYTFNVTANLRGSWNGSTAMNTTLNTAGLIPLSQPYNVTPFNYTGTESVAAIPNTNVVDWVLVEHRKPSTGLPADALSSTITGRKAAFLLNNGTVVELDGVTPVAVDITKQGSAFITIRHRNHLGVLSNSIPSNAAGTFTNDYTVLANNYLSPGATSDPVVLLAGVAGKYGLWSGDANKNGIVNITDVNAIKAAIAAFATGYQFTDVNLSNSINATDINITKATISAFGSGSNPARTTNQTPIKVIKTNLPDPIFE